MSTVVNTFKRVVTRFLEETPFGGFIYIVQSRSRAEKIFWIITVGLCVVGLAAQEIAAVWDYAYAVPATTYQIEQKQEMQLPDIAICFDALFDKKKIEKHTVPKDIAWFAQLGFVMKVDWLIRHITEVFKVSIQYDAFVQSRNLTFYPLVERLSFDAKTTFDPGCMNNSTWINCSESDTRFWQYPGVCFKLKSPKQVMEGPRDGLRVRFKTLDDRQFYHGTFNSPIEKTKRDGVFLYLFDDQQLHQTITYLPRMSNIHVSLEPIRTTLLPGGSSGCSESVNHDGSSDCLVFCVNEITNCNCPFIDTVHLLPNRSATESCSRSEVMQCLTKSWKQIEGLRSNPIAALTKGHKCLMNCQVACNSSSHERTVSSFPLSHGSGRMDLISLDLHFRKMQLQTVEQFHERSLGELFGKAGGLLGFWLGGSIFAFIHLLSVWIPVHSRTFPADDNFRNGAVSRNWVLRAQWKRLVGFGYRFAAETPLHGFGYVVNTADTKKRLFWAGTIGVCTAFFLIQGLHAVLNYALDLPATSINAEQRLEMQLPNAVVCLPGHFSRQRVEDMQLGKNFTDHLMRGFVMSPWAATPRDDELLARNEADFVTYMSNHNASYSTLVGSLTPTVLDIFGERGCRHTILKDCEKLTRKFWFWPGLCFEVTSPKQLRGLPYGSRFTIHPNGNRHKKTKHAWLKPHLLFPGAIRQIGGVYLFLSNGEGIEARHMFMSSGSYIIVSLAPRRIHTLSNRKYKCGKDDYDTCVSRCVVDVKLGNCSCKPIDAYENDERNRPICNPAQAVRCRLRADHQRGAVAIPAALISCIATRCRQSCARIEYRRTISSLPWNDTLYNHFTNNKGPRIQIHLQYETMNLLTIEQFYATSFGDLIATIGGHSGLWLGGSVIAFVHLLKFSVTYAVVELTSYWSRRSRNLRK